MSTDRVLLPVPAWSPEATPTLHPHLYRRKPACISDRWVERIKHASSLLELCPRLYRLPGFSAKCGRIQQGRCGISVVVSDPPVQNRGDEDHGSMATVTCRSRQQRDYR
ncbi:hypothetical protein PoB_001734400 [Plakobranchus ocellatus]|uniref:Uncharacterized protein n=1 Tax=Plakobranchus ocellatus TaxID=259542 RepID=A0AAV3Z684_9GAST|nr:hypothetical protein PoB_001734400 [Plakobranchus ocellatus]